MTNKLKEWIKRTFKIGYIKYETLPPEDKIETISSFMEEKHPEIYFATPEQLDKYKTLYDVLQIERINHQNKVNTTLTIIIILLTAINIYLALR